MRGRRVVPPAIPVTVRNTPAHAGKTKRTQEEIRIEWKHPRACGEDGIWEVLPIRNRETPPRMRGRLRRRDRRIHCRGNTPAHAGKTTPVSTTTRTDKKHPRACGEDATANFSSFASLETPPRMRGRRPTQGSCPVPLRNTPAHAGKTAPLASLQPLH